MTFLNHTHAAKQTNVKNICHFYPNKTRFQHRVAERMQANKDENVARHRKLALATSGYVPQTKDCHQLRVQTAQITMVYGPPLNLFLPLVFHHRKSNSRGKPLK